MADRKQLVAGEIYLKILVSEGGVDKTYVAFPNENWTPENKQPKYRTNSANHSIAVWINRKKVPTVIVEDLI